MPEWIIDTMPPCAGVYDVTLHLTSRRGKQARATALAHWPGRNSRRWNLLDICPDDAFVVAWRPRPAPYSGPRGAVPLGSIMPAEFGV